MKKAMRWLAIVVGVLVLFLGTGYGWASFASSSSLERTIEVHEVDFPIPFPLTEAEVQSLRGRLRAEAVQAEAETEAETETETEAGTETEAEAEMAVAAGSEPGADARSETEPGSEVEAAPPVDPLAGVDLPAIALERAVARGKHLVEARYACNECHGLDFGGGTMVDDPMIGRLLGPNITMGEGSRTRDYSAADWDRIVRHGLTRDGRPTAMPAQDFERMSDRELSDIVAYIRSMPPVDRAVEPVSLGLLGKVLLATGQLPLSADLIRDHRAEHPAEPPREEPTAEFGAHLAAVCTGCHRADFTGGPIRGGAPEWPPASNITPHESGIAGWTYEDFVRAMREAKRPDGSELAMPMSGVTRFAEAMTETELRAMWAYLSTLEPRTTAE